MPESCFCHFNGYQVKDAVARASIAAEETARQTADYHLQSYINERVKTYDTLADLVADANVYTDEVAVTLGKVTLNDGLGATYYVRAKVTGDTASDSLILLDDTTKVAVKAIINDSCKDVLNLSSFSIGETATERLQNAINYVSENNLILYIDETINITESIVLPSNVHIKSNKEKYKIFTTTGVSLNGLAMFVAYGKNNIIFDNVKIENTGYGQSGSTGTAGLFDGFGGGLNLGGCNNITITNCEFFKCGGYDYGEGCAMLWISCCKNAFIENNHFYCGDNGIAIDRWYASTDSTAYNDNINIIANTIEHLSGRAIAIENNTGYTISSIIITNNIIRSCGYAAIEGRAFQKATIANNDIDFDNTLKVNPATAYNLSESGWDWSSNIINSTPYGIIMYNGGCDCIVNANRIYNVKQAISLSETSKITITSNKILTIGTVSTERAIYLQFIAENNGCVISDNTVESSTTGIRLSCTQTTPVTLNIIVNNNIISAQNNSIEVSLIKNALIANNIIKTVLGLALDGASLVNSVFKGNVCYGGGVNITGSYNDFDYICYGGGNSFRARSSSYLTVKVKASGCTNIFNCDTSVTNSHCDIIDYVDGIPKPNGTYASMTVYSDSDFPLNNIAPDDKQIYSSVYTKGCLGRVYGNGSWHNFGTI